MRGSAKCPKSLDIVALYALHESVYVPYILGAPDFVNREFRELFQLRQSYHGSQAQTLRASPGQR